MKRYGRAVGIVLGGLAIAASAWAQQPAPPVWRCGNSYSHQPCAAGSAIDVRDARSDAQRRQADLQTQRLHALGAQLHQENTAREAQRRREEAVRQRELARQRALQAAAARKAQAAERRRVVRRHRPSATRRVVIPKATPSQ